MNNEQIEQKIIEIFLKSWKKKAKREYDESPPFCYQDNWSGKAVMDFAKEIYKFALKKEKPRIEKEGEKS